MFHVVSVLVLVWLPVLSNASFNQFCGSLTVPPCFQVVPRDVLFLVDKSSSLDQATIAGPMLDYVQQLYCAFDSSTGSQVGLISFGNNVKVDIPFQERSTDEWYVTLCVDVRADSRTDARAQAVENIRNDLNNDNANTPTAEALETAVRELEAHGDPTHVKFVIVVTDGGESMIKQLVAYRTHPAKYLIL